MRETPPTRKGKTLLRGHTLISEGRAYRHGIQVRVGVGRCSCGAVSPELTGNSARKRWHADHKADVRAAAAGPREDSRVGEWGSD